MNRYGTVCLLVILAVALSVLTVGATQILYQSPQQLGQQAALVVRGKVANVESFWNDTHTKILTRTRIAVDETYKGADQRFIDVIQLGGTVGTVKVTVHGALHWTPGEEVLLFAEPHDALSYRVSGFSQGKYNIERDPTTGMAYINRPAMEGAEVLGAPSAHGLQRVSETKRVSLEQFISRALDRR